MRRVEQGVKKRIMKAKFEEEEKKSKNTKTTKTTTNEKIVPRHLLRLILPPKMDPLSNASFHLNGIWISEAGIFDSKATI